MEERLSVKCLSICNYFLISQFFTDKHYDMPSLVPTVSQKVDMAANALRRVAVLNHPLRQFLISLFLWCHTYLINF